MTDRIIASVSAQQLVANVRGGRETVSVQRPQFVLGVKQGLPGPPGPAGASGVIVVDCTCTAAEAVEDLVYIDSAPGGVPDVRTVDVDDDAKMPAVGVVTEKPTATTCKVLAYGELTISGASFTPGNRLWVSTGSQLDDVPPAPPGGGTRLIQAMGWAHTAEDVVLAPSTELTRIRPTP